MVDLKNPQILSVLACPDCAGDMKEAGKYLVCVSCQRKYEIRKGIPILYASTIDADHLREEEALAKMMGRKPTSRKDAFNLKQWALSKDEFWGMVRNKVKAPPGTFINVGCGYDSHFSEFERQGNTFVNFDAVYEMLRELQDNHGATTCVVGDINALPFKKCTFDYVVSIDVIHHESDKIKDILRSFRDLLKPGGTLFLEDPNAWGIFQMAKSLFLPKPIYRFLRTSYHNLKASTHKPADYEFPTSIWRVRSILKELGFSDIEIYPNGAYPCIGEVSHRLYAIIEGIEFVRKYHNYHYMLSAIRG